MYKLVIQGGTPLRGNVKASGSKNSSLPILFSSILADSPITLQNAPQLSDISTTLKLLMSMGAEFILESDSSLYVDASKLDNLVADYNLVKTMRAAILALGPMLAKYGKAKVSLPGGCAIGTRPVDLHLKALKELGATIEVKNGYIYAEAENLVGADIYFDQISVTATENVIMAATLAQGTTTINNAAQEPEVSDLSHCLNKMGAKISGIGTSVIVIEGVKKLNGVQYSVCSDRIEVATYLVAAAITGGSITVKGTNPKAMRSVLGKLIETGADIKTDSQSITLNMNGKRAKAVNIKTGTYPNFPTDMQAQFTALNAIAEGHSSITENIFENRFMHIPELMRMGANLTLEGNTVFCKGVKSLTGAHLIATDLRASASLVLAGLAAKGTTTIERVYHLDRGYETIEEKLKLLGANIERVQD
ncbi:UDP-N-acetylglucosamine 1-carboxyvinyltransferase (EC [Bathymodiolus thermophilus thioautotrophic gill symbiont]|uniref:UDP-N-acetylglucosamine 1-carboxyvinyltransferase n=1 Tax=Bathymodiolus thermophilus thioautotrophic gill symbiont TaxID=2360 RepID=A0A1J5U795_9GAMM|nr:UDP-N-acetylglucosamine 1-carboxyvinyltransferase [Bathymodiolus thermophilus thioautotrophic gill symbiont]AYQ56674.1 UDP-N-acetylglucosamine 1-carboxyvinyltransferase [Bathymodiolus thermophilus thioautotrophic gill symbiont]OIR24694.1 UDP-N-acetylglucosamine 1-carboxyvinyltransferase [Bathymodiolus thermophilus thioautotrophic gill symbiont]CAB5498177.1 UDP-N-acetylglucosamine 1-carboxyvinyltransferase (EC [Bathymodiolus thermophilus thioautotrophic gill symbiont]CAB5503078.1 UDP-N-acetyl